MSQNSKNLIHTRPKISVWTRLSFQQYTMAGLSLAAFLIGVIQWQDQQGFETSSLFLESSLQTALMEAEQADKLCLVYVSREYCYPCDRFMEQAGSNEELTEIFQDEYVSIGIKQDEHPTDYEHLNQEFQLSQFPTILITDSEGQELQRYHDLQVQQLIPELLQLSRLRVAPVHKKDSPGPRGHWAQEADLLSDQQDTDFGSGEENTLGVRMFLTTDYQKALHQAELLSQSWKKGVWIQNNKKGQYELIIGTFESRKQARLTTKYLQGKGSKDVKIVRLSPAGINP